MANVLGEQNQQAISALHVQGKSIRWIVSGKPSAYPNGSEAVLATDRDHEGDDEWKDSTERSNSGRGERLPMSGKKLVEVGRRRGGKSA